MSLADLSIKRPVFVTALAVILVAVGLLSMKKMPVDQFPDVTFPIVIVSTTYAGAGPEEVETLVSKILEEEISTVTGIKRLSSNNIEGLSTVIAEFTLETDLKYAEQQIRDKTSSARPRLPDDIEEPVIRRIDPADQPIMILGVKANLKEAELFDLADNVIKPRIEQVNNVGKVEIIGGREREIQVQLDRNKLKDFEISATQVVGRINAVGQNIPAGKKEGEQNETVFRTLGEFKDIKDIANVVVSFLGNDVPVTVSNVGKVVDTVKDEKARAYLNGEQALFIGVYRQSGANTVAVADNIKKRVDKMKDEVAQLSPGAEVSVVRDGAKPIRANVDDVKEAIIIGVFLTIFVVFFFLGSAKSTFITGLALPNSLIGAFFLMSIAGFSINIMSLLALSLAVGLLIDDAIVVRENIFRHVEMGKSSIRAASEGTKEVMLAVIATTFAVIAVFAPIGFLDGMVGQFFKEFGLTVCFVMIISLFDALTMAPMLSAYFAGNSDHKKESTNFFSRMIDKPLKAFDRFQTWLENIYENVLEWTIRHPIKVIGSGLLLFFISLYAAKFIPKTFLPPQDQGEFMVTLEMPPGTSLEGMAQLSQKADQTLRENKEIQYSILMIGSSGKPNSATFYITLVPGNERSVNTTGMKDRVREQMKIYKDANPIISDISIAGGGERPFNLNIIGSDLKELEDISMKVFEKLKNHPGLLDVDIGFRPGKPEFQVVPDKQRAERLGVLTTMIGAELRTHIEGTEAAVFREKGEEYDIRVRLQDDQRDLKAAFDQIYVPNVNQSLVRLKDVAAPVETTGPSDITRQDRGRYIQIRADVSPTGPGMAAVISDINTLLTDEIKLPPGMRYGFTGQAESFQELMTNMVVAVLLGVLFIYLVLASLYESFVTPFTIMMVLPLAACGAFFALLMTMESLNIFSMIGCVMLLGVATKNSILLVDYTNQLLAEGMSYADAVVKAGKVRLRPILMTSIALIAGMLPIAIGLNEASKQRTSMGVAIIGGVISSTLLTLLVVPAAFSYMERFRIWSLAKVKKIVGVDTDLEENPFDEPPQAPSKPKTSNGHSLHS